MANVKCSLNISVGKRIKLLREHNGWLQAYVADLIGISTSSYSKIESGTTDINFSRLEQIALIYKINVVELFSNDVSHETETLPVPPLLKKKIDEREAEIEKLHVKIKMLSNELEKKKWHEGLL